jgi:hypothetical protein
MPNTCFDPSDLIIPAFDTNAKTSELIVHVHPGQIRILSHLTASDHIPFRDRDDVIRWCICFGSYSLVDSLPSSFALCEAKMNILQDERFERQKDCLGDSVQKYLAAGQKENAHRLVDTTFEEYRRISNPYWRSRWLSTLEAPIEMLERHGIHITPKIAADTSSARLNISLRKGSDSL